MSEREGRYERAVGDFFALHREDPRRVEQGGGSVPWSVFYHERMRFWLETISPDAGEALRLAASCQHICRWELGRESYPEGKLGYKKWRRDLAVFHGEKAAGILERAGYEAELIQRVRELLLKKDLKTDPEVQALEDVACLVFVENELPSFAVKHEDEKVIAILRKTWKKMSPRGHREALKVAANLPAPVSSLIGRALA